MAHVISSSDSSTLIPILSSMVSFTTVAYVHGHVSVGIVIIDKNCGYSEASSCIHVKNREVTKNGHTHASS